MQLLHVQKSSILLFYSSWVSLVVVDRFSKIMVSSWTGSSRSLISTSFIRESTFSNNFVLFSSFLGSFSCFCSDYLFFLYLSLFFYFRDNSASSISATFSSVYFKSDTLCSFAFLNSLYCS